MVVKILNTDLKLYFNLLLSDQHLYLSGLAH